MGLSIDNIRLLTLTQRKADLEYDIAIDTQKKMALANESAEYSQEYYRRLQAKDIAYYANGQYNQMSYSYLMGNGYSTAMDIAGGDTALYKKDNSMILTDAFGLVVMSDAYADVLRKVLGSSCIDANGKGGTFSIDKIPAIIAEIGGANCTEEKVKEIIDGGRVQYGYNVSTVNTLSGETTATNQNHDASDTLTTMIENIVNFFYPIFQAAAANGWTTEYNQDMQANSNYVSDALSSGSLQLAQVKSDGNYDPETSLTYFVTNGLVLERTDSSTREEVNAWYNAIKEDINFQESLLDVEIQELSTELEATKTEIEAINSLMEDDQKPFEWCT